MSAELTVKVCILGAPRSGKTILSRCLAEQSSISDYTPTAGVRIQVLSRVDAKVQLWDVAGDQQYQPAWPVLAKDVDGVLLVIDPQHPEQERELEQFYLKFAQPHNLTMKQCCVVAVSHGDTDHQVAWSGLKGKLSKLPAGSVHLNSKTPESGRKAASDLLDRLLVGCISQKKDKLERAVLAD